MTTECDAKQESELKVWSQEARLKNAYKRNIIKLQNCKADHGSSCLCRSTDTQLSKLCSKLRKEYKDRKRGVEDEIRRMTDERIDELESLGFDWKSRKPYLKLTEET